MKKKTLVGLVWFGFTGEYQKPPCYIILKPEKKYGFDSDTIFISEALRKFAGEKVKITIEKIK